MASTLQGFKAAMLGWGTATRARRPLDLRSHGACALLVLAGCGSSDTPKDTLVGNSAASDGAVSLFQDAASGAVDASGSSATQSDSGQAMTLTDAGATLGMDAGKSDASSSAADAAGTTGSDAGDAALSSGPGGPCTRDSLKAAVDQYYSAYAAHDPKLAPLAANVKYTENGKSMMVGEGLWKTAGKVKFKRMALDIDTCNVAMEAVIPDGSADRIIGLRLKLDPQKISEIETIVVRQGEYITDPSPSGLIATQADDWETILAEADRPTRQDLTTLIDKYFTLFPAGACNFDPSCQRFENGLSIAQCDLFLSCSNSGPSDAAGVMRARLHVLDVEEGIAIGLTMFQGMYSDMHMFKVRKGKVVAVHAVLDSATSSGWD